MSEPLVMPKPGQSLGGLVIEAAAALGERTIRGLLASAGTSLLGLVHHAAAVDELAAVAEGLDLEPDALVSRCHVLLPGADHRRSYFGASIDGRMLEKRTRRFSPATLADEPWHRACWQLRPLPFCEKSWTLITDACHSCGAVQRWSRAWGTDLCDACAAPLREGTTLAVPASIRPSLRQVAGLLHHDAVRRAESMAALPPNLAPLGAGGCFDVLCAIAGAVDPTIRSSSNPQLPSKTADRRRTIAAIARAWDLLVGWPKAVLGHCDARLARRAGRHGDGNEGATATLLALHGRNGASAPLRTAVTALRSVLVARQSGHVDARAFALLSGIGARDVARSRRAGRIPSILGLTDAAKVVPLLPVSAAKRFRHDMTSSLTAERAASMIGCTYRGVEELVRVGLLAGSGPTIRSSASDRLRIQAASLDEMVETLVRRRGTPSEGSFDVPMARAMWRIGGRLKPWSAVLNALTDGSMRFAMLSGSRPLAERVLLRADDADMIQTLSTGFDDADPRFDRFMSQKDAFSVLNTEARFAKDLAARWRTSRGLERTVPVLDVLELAVGFISLREIAALTGVTASACARNIVRHGGSRSAGSLHDRAATLAVLGLHGLADPPSPVDSKKHRMGLGAGVQPRGGDRR